MVGIEIKNEGLGFNPHKMSLKLRPNLKHKGLIKYGNESKINFRNEIRTIFEVYS